MPRSKEEPKVTHILPGDYDAKHLFPLKLKSELSVEITSPPHRISEIV